LRFRKLTGDADLSKPKQAASTRLELRSEPSAFQRCRLRTGFPQRRLRENNPSRRCSRAKVTSIGSHSGRSIFINDSWAPLPPIRFVDGWLKLRVFVDTSSVEVFVNDGETVLTSLIFPSPESTGVGLSFQKGELRRGYLEVWKLRSAWPR
jgi:hypothetical protein